MTRQSLRAFLKYAVYTLLVLAVFVLQSTPGALVLCGLKPLLVLPVCVCIAACEGEFTGALMGAFGGLLCGFSSDTIFGYDAILFLILCCAAGLAFIYLIRVTLTNVLLASLGALFIRALLDFFFSYALWGYDGLSTLFYTYTAPSAVWAAAFTPIFYLVVRLLCKAFEPAEEKEADF